MLCNLKKRVFMVNAVGTLFFRQRISVLRVVPVSPLCFLGLD